MSITYGFCLKDSYNSREFSESFQALIGDGVYPSLGKLQVISQNSMSVNVSGGFALLAGRYFKTTTVESLSFSAANNNFDRYDAVILRANSRRRKVELLGITGVATAFPKPYIPVRSEDQYEIVLCHVLVRKGTTKILSSDLTDTRGDPSLCGFITPLSSIAQETLRVFNFFKEGIDDEVKRLLNLSNELIQKGEDTVKTIEMAMAEAQVSEDLGSIRTLIIQPTPHNEWLECTGGSVPPQYPELNSMLGGKLPLLNLEGPPFKSWVYAGPPKSTKEV